jgi:hypothetical protein
MQDMTPIARTSSGADSTSEKDAFQRFEIRGSFRAIRILFFFRFRQKKTPGT